VPDRCIHASILLRRIPLRGFFNQKFRPLIDDQI